MSSAVFPMLLLLCFFQNGDATVTPSLEEIVAKNIEARGGADRWKAVQSMKITGAYTSFSTPAPFTVYRKRPDLYRFDHFLGPHEVVRCYDGQKAWWINPFMGPRFEKAQPIFEPQHRVTLVESPIDFPFLHYRNTGAKMELLGKTKLEGADHFKIKVTPEHGDEAVWYLHAGTWLETMVETTTYVYGRPSPLEAFFGDYRTVEGLVIPFLEEQEFHTRARTIEIENVAIDIPIEDALFRMPEPDKNTP